jgi:hypothetical protein
MAGNDDSDFLSMVIEEIGFLFAPFADAVDSADNFRAFMADLGWDISEPIDPLSSMAPSLQRFDGDSAGSDLTSVLGNVGQIFSAIRALANVPQSILPASVDANAFAAEFPRQLIDKLLIDYLLDSHACIGRALQLAGVIRMTDVAAAPPRFAYVRREVAWNDLPRVLSEPGAVFANAYNWGQSDFAGLTLLRVVVELLGAYGLPASVGTIATNQQNVFNRDALQPLPIAERETVGRVYFLRNWLTDPKLEAGLAFAVLPETASGKPGLAIVPYAEASDAVQFPITDDISAFIKIDADLFGGVMLSVRPKRAPKLDVGFLSGNVAAGAKLSTGLALSKSGDGAFLLFGRSGGTRLSSKSFSITGGMRVQTGDAPDAFAEIAVDTAEMVLQLSGGDSFLATILPAELRLDFSITLGVDSVKGLYFTGSGGLEIDLPVHIDLGPIEIIGALVAIKPSGQAIPFDLAASIKGNFGPLEAVVENVGVRISLSFPPSGGNLGPLDLSVGLRPPNGVGLSIDASVVKGGGYLYFDFDNEEYAGALELKIADFLDLKAIGLITTKMPDGSKGFSLLVIITAEFNPGFQLGYGFKLIGVGGLLGLNRTMVLQPLAEGVRTGAVNGILFPVDPVANAPRIISDLRTIFPPVLNHFVIGPMGKLGWMTPTVVSLELGVLIEIPGNVAILGVLRLAIGDDDGGEPVLRLQVNFIGAIEFDKKRGWFFAAIFDSRLLTFTIEGEMGMLIVVGDEPNFLISTGGFHPQYQPPPLPFPSPKRIAVNIIDTDDARIRAEAYFALTPNTLQFGARAELHFGFDSFSVDGFFSFDALARISAKSVYFIIEVSAGVSLKVGGAGVFSIDLDLTLEGTSPWRARGSASINVMFVKVSASFDKTFGSPLDFLLPPVVLVSVVTDELGKADNWRALPPLSANLAVSLRDPQAPADTIILHPLGTLEVSQNVLPFGITLDKFGARTPTDANRFDVGVTGGDFVKVDDARRTFARAQFQNMTDAQKLSAPAYEPQVSGIALNAGHSLRCGRAVRRTLRNETIVIDALYRRAVRPMVALAGVLFRQLVKSAAVTNCDYSQARKREKQPFADTVTVRDPGFAVVSLRDNSLLAGSGLFVSQAAAEEWMAMTAANDPGLAAEIHVVPATETSQAA